MTRYRYVCAKCDTTSPVVRTRWAAENERDDHRHLMHGGHIPTGDRIQRAARQPVDRTALISLGVLGVVLLVSLLFGH